MAFNVPTTRQIIRTGIQDLEVELDQQIPIVGVERALNIAFSGALRDIYDYQSWIVNQIIPSDKSDDETIIDTARNEGVIRKSAAYASGPVVFTATSPVPLDTSMQTQDGVSYHVIATESPSGGQVRVTVQADEVGTSGNLASGDVLTLVSPIAGVNSDGVVATEGVSGGADIETISELLTRLLYRKRNPPVGGALHDYVIWATQTAGVSRAWAFDNWHGVGTVGLAWVYDQRDDIIPTDTDRAAMQSYLFRHQDPATSDWVGKPGGVEVWPIPLTLKPLDMEIRVVPDTTATRNATLLNLNALFRSISPGDTLLLSSIRTAIGSATGVTDYELSLTGNQTSENYELITLGAVTWRIV
ncbi:phage baseplate protein [Serratia marcescens]|uniref:Baseplate J/gp47 family protein n=1 Tax=Serratia marcescens TaxID=615 RepID=A0ABD5BI20_SERMA|nr:baseplate J/gp47 family protein [Serratia marcescens]MCZ6928671.1 phage baseplate protein [Serratia marcescens]MDE5234324.1 baseplate J/gp47 family protein [Serratia marcescens]MDE5257509.1 baseplate J/gp47 family protein [Serratia marcescens]MDQ9402279.1 baseplate J/gp47 family protein [Serratia marcescens]MDQ9424670.1 baseplate J/gp47 family protein [Serratia marcescens]